MLPAPCSSYSNSQRSDINRRVRKAQRDAVVDLVQSTIDTFLSKPCDEPQVLTIRVPDISVTVAELTPDEASLMVNNPYYDKLLEAGENKKRVHAACAAARRFLVEQAVPKNARPPELKKPKKVPSSTPKPDRVDLPSAVWSRRGAGIDMHPSGIGSNESTSMSTVSTATGKSFPQMRFPSRSSSTYGSSTNGESK
ncbi:unnamed protein product [Cylicocyclus nassatus]|uniref:Uncharacterized protein n=1 Tax=Cylicocyclus nassatus TaxID=53992 RepID=A0AA36MGJ0_CYLNA|nr:unnamed protein product [Cylicocyclus nassatus]